MRQSLRSIQLFVAAFEELSFTQAAQREAATQSGVSQHVSELEASLGVALFTRKGGAVTATPAGTAYYSACIELLNAGERALRAVKPFRTGVQGRIIVGLTPVITRAVLAPAYARFNAANPNVSVQVIDANYGNLADRVRSGEMTFAVVPAVVGLKGVRARPFARSPELLVSGPDGPFPHRATVTPADLAAISLVVPGAQNARRRMIETYLSANGVVPRQVTEFESMFGTLDLVRQGAWSTVLPTVMMGRDFVEGSFRINPIIKPDLVLDLYVLEPARRGMDESAQAFLACLREEITRIHDAATRAQRRGARRTGSSAAGRAPDQTS